MFVVEAVRKQFPSITDYCKVYGYKLVPVT